MTDSRGSRSDSDPGPASRSVAALISAFRSASGWGVTRVVELLMTALGVVVLVLVGLAGSVGLAALLAWDVVGFAYVVLVSLRLRRSAMRGDAVDDLSDRSRAVQLIRSVAPAITSLIGLTASLMVVFGSGFDEADRILVRVLGVVTMVLAWSLLHYSFAYRYFVVDHEAPGLDFPGRAHPIFSDYVYFAMAVGTSFAVPDVDVTTPRMRWHLMVHSIVGFFYNAIVLATAFKTLTGG